MMIVEAVGLNGDDEVKMKGLTEEAELGQQRSWKMSRIRGDIVAAIAGFLQLVGIQPLLHFRNDLRAMLTAFPIGKSLFGQAFFLKIR